MDNKYYIPEFSEFHHGFNYEWKKKDWTEFMPATLANRIPDEHDHDENFNPIEYRVKYLDSQDISDCGWKLWGHSDLKALGQIDHYDIIKQGEHTYLIRDINYDDLSSRGIFEGEIKNKSELIFLMKRLHINVG